MDDKNHKNEELMKLKNEINSQIEDIIDHGGEKTIDRLKKIHAHLDDVSKVYYNDVDKDLRRFNKISNGLSSYQRFLNSFSNDVKIDPGRLMGLTDGIFGMVMTLLIFGIALPEMKLVSAGDFLVFIESLTTTFGVTLVSFILIASFWIYNHEFVKVKRLNIPYLWLNILYLIGVSFIPFTTSIIGSYSYFFLADVLFGFNILYTLSCFVLMFWYADRRGFLEKDLSKAEKKYIHHTFLIILVLTAIVNILGFNVSCNYIYLFLLVPIISTIRDINFRMKHNI